MLFIPLSLNSDEIKLGPGNDEADPYLPDTYTHPSPYHLLLPSVYFLLFLEL